MLVRVTVFFWRRLEKCPIRKRREIVLPTTLAGDIGPGFGRDPGLLAHTISERIPRAVNQRHERREY